MSEAQARKKARDYLKQRGIDVSKYCPKCGGFMRKLPDQRHLTGARRCVGCGNFEVEEK